MQKVSYMRRNSSTQNFVDICLFIGFLLIYDALSSMQLILPPLFGILFLSFVKLFEGERYYSLFAFVITLGIMEANKGFAPGTLFVVYCLIYIFVFNRIEKMFRFVNIFKLIYTPIIYVALLILNSFISFGDESSFLTPMILWYIIAESLIMVGRWILDIR